MALFKQILIPVDFSSSSTAALRLGASLAARFQASVTLLHVHELWSYGLPAEYEMYSQELRTRILAEIDKSLAAEKLRAETAGAPRVEAQRIEGYPGTDIAEFARKGGFDLIVMGTHGRKGVKHAVLGSVAERTVRLASCPVLTVRTPGEPAIEAAEVWPPRATA